MGDVTMPSGGTPSENPWFHILQKFADMLGIKSARPEDSLDYKNKRTMDELGQPGTGEAPPDLKANPNDSAMMHPKLQMLFAKLGGDKENPSFSDPTDLPDSSSVASPTEPGSEGGDGNIGEDLKALMEKRKRLSGNIA